MADPLRKPATSSYERDFFSWTEEQARLLKAKRAAGLDWDNLAEEIETLGRSERAEIRSRVLIILQHLLKWQFQPEGRGTSWRASLVEQRDQLNQSLDESPSLTSYPGRIVDRQYRIARLRAAAETGLPIERFPASNPYAVDEILNESFYPGDAD